MVAAAAKRGRVALAPEVTLEEITPRRAEEMLQYNVGNRSLSAAQVESLARDMAAGRWILNGSTIAFATGGRLMDGQHRLAAVVKSGATITVFVAWNLEEEAMKSIDLGRARKVSDVMRIMVGMGNSIAVAAVCRTIALLEVGSIESRLGRRITYGETMAIYERYAADITHMEEVVGREIHPGIPSGGANVIAPLAFMRAVNAQKIDALAARLASGNYPDPGDPARALSKAISVMGGRGSHERKTLVARTLRAIESELRAEPMMVAKVDSGVFERCLLARLGKKKAS